jgi:hypothetical protein
MLIQLLFYRLTSAIVGEGTPIHITDIIAYEQHLASLIPTLKLQSLLLHPDHFLWYDGVASFFYFLGIMLPYVFGVFLFVKKETKVLQHFLVGFVILNVLGFITYLLYPAAPPWLASSQGYLPQVHRILLDFFDTIGFTSMRTYYAAVNHHPTAAVPSLHMAYMVLPIPYLVTVLRRNGVLISLFANCLMLFTIVYLGEHYIFDALTGAIYALSAFVFSNFLYRRILLPSFGVSHWPKHQNCAPDHQV